jgi:microsomal dipeptidase-like Zn-dependent dipeptidase
MIKAISLVRQWMGWEGIGYGSDWNGAIYPLWIENEMNCNAMKCR